MIYHFFSAQQHLNKVSRVSRLLTEKIERSASTNFKIKISLTLPKCNPPLTSLGIGRTNAIENSSFQSAREMIGIDVDTGTRNIENKKKEDEYQNSLKTMSKASETLVGFINDHSTFTVTHADVLTGIFPWNKPESITNLNHKLCPHYLDYIEFFGSKLVSWKNSPLLTHGSSGSGPRRK